MLAMVVNDNAGVQTALVILTTIASVLAPTGLAAPHARARGGRC
jgi:hypothetical protein